MKEEKVNNIEKKLKNMYPLKKSDMMWGYIFIAPLSLGLLFFLAYPLFSALFISFADYDLFNPPQLIGMKNFVEAFGDEMFLRSLLNAVYSAVGVPLGMVLALILSSFLVGKIKGSTVFRSIYFIPTICGTVAVTFIWRWMYAPYYGLLDNLFTAMNMEAPNWLGGNRFMPSMIFMGVWGGMGISILLFVSSLKNISTTYYEAADIDGANAFQKFINITLPGISPITFYILVTGLIGAFQDFTRFQVMRGGVFNKESIMPVWWIYNFTGEFGYRYGYASAMGLILGVIILLASGINFICSKYWVKYDN